MAHVLIAGGGIGGLSAALALARAGARVSLFERAQEFSEVGAGIQLGPNVMRVLHGWGLKDALDAVIAIPDRLQIRSATSGAQLGCMPLGDAMKQRYGAPYATVHRADLHAVLVQSLRQQSGASLQLNNAVLGVKQSDTGLAIELVDGEPIHGDVLVAADGSWSALRQQLLHDGKPQATGHLAYRAMVPKIDLPASTQSQQVTVWLGPKLHVVQYPVRGGRWLNVVAIVHGHVTGDMQHWDHSANAQDLQRAMAATCAPLNGLIHAIDHWQLWPLSIRPPMCGAHQHAKGRVAFLGDSAHPMLPYLAQGAAMAIEDASVLTQVLTAGSFFDDRAPLHGCISAPNLLQIYAKRRWQRNARVQARAIRNGEFFHATGPMRWARDVGMKLLGQNLLDMPWLYGEKPELTAMP